MALTTLETNIVLDVYDHDGTRPSIKSIALDDNTRYVFARLTYQGETYDIGSTATVKLIIIRPDKVGAQVAGEAKAIQMGQEDESIVTVYGAYAELDQPAIAVAGTLLGQFIITSGTQILRSQIFAVNNGEALDADEWAGQYDGYNLDELVARVNDAVERVDDMEADVTELKSGLSVRIPDIEIGSIDGTTGQDAAGPRRARTVGYIDIKDFWYCDPRGTDYSVIIFIYDEDKNYIKRLTNGFLGGRVTDYEILKNYTNAGYVRVAFAKPGSANMTDEDLVNLRPLIRVYRTEDGTIMHGSEVMQTNVNESIAQIDGDWFGTGYVGVEVGSLNSSTGENTDNAKRCRTSGYIAIDDFVSCDLIGTEYLAMYFLYEADKTFMLYVPFDFDTFDLTRFGIVRNYPNAKYVRFAIKRTDASTITDSDLAFLRTRIFVKIGVRRVDVDRARFDGQFNYVAYSKLSTNDAPINTEEHFINCANTEKFTALKGDVRNTADGGLIMCHDAGYTFDSNGKITSYDKNNNTPIDTLTVAQCKALTFATQWEGKDCHPCDFETFVRVCKKHGLIAYVTVRDEHIADVVAPEVLRILTLYRMTDHAIINSFTRESLEIFRSLHPTITLSQVMNHWYIPTNDDVDYVYSLGNCIINLFNVPVQDSVPGTNVEDKLENLLSTSEYVAMLEYARSRNVVVYDAQCGNAAPDVLLKHGIVGAHMTVVPDYDWKRT